MSGIAVNSLFDYEALDVETRIVVRQKTGEIRERVKRTREDIIEIGERLIEVKGYLGHGRFGEWLAAEFEWSDRTARSFMDVASVFKSEIISDLDITPTALRTLAAPSVPEAARQEAIDRASDGERIGTREAKGIVNNQRPVSPTSSPTLKGQRSLFDEPDGGEDEPDPEPESGPLSQPDRAPPASDPGFAADRWNGRIKKLKDDIFLLTNSIPRRGGIAKLTETWPRKSVQVTIQYLADLREVADQCLKELRGTLK